MFNYRDLDEGVVEFVAVAAVAEVGDGERLLIEIDEKPIAVFNIAGKYFAIDDICSHDEGPLADGDLDGRSIECPRHGARFDLENGKVLSMPAVTDIAAYPVRVMDDEIQVGLPVEGE